MTDIGPWCMPDAVGAPEGPLSVDITRGVISTCPTKLQFRDHQNLATFPEGLPAVLVVDLARTTTTTTTTTTKYILSTDTEGKDYLFQNQADAGSLRVASDRAYRRDLDRHTAAQPIMIHDPPTNIEGAH